MATRGQSQIHVELMQGICDEITTSDFARLKDQCKAKSYGGFGAGQLEKIVTLSDLFAKLQQRRIFKEGDYTKLKLLLGNDNEAVLDLIVEAERQLCSAGIPVVGYAPQGSHWPAMHQETVTGHQHERYAPYNSNQASSMSQGFHSSEQPPQQQGYPRDHQHQVHQQSDAMPSLVQPSSQMGPPSQTGPPSQMGPASLPGHLMSMPMNHMPSHVNQSYSSPQMDYAAGAHTSIQGNYNTNHNLGTLPSNDGYYRRGMGYILFINNSFENRPNGYDKREGAEIDTRSITELWENSLRNNYELYIEKEVGSGKFWGILADTRQKLAMKDYSCFILIISSHGVQEEMKEKGQMTKDSIVMVDAAQVTVDEIREFFNGSKAPSLIGKPKVFIIQACRGLSLGQGVIDRSDCITPTPALPTPPRQLTRPDNADVLVAYATSAGTKAWRNSSEGTWYIYQLCKAIHSNHRQEHFLDLLLSVHSNIAARDANTNESANSNQPAKQMPCYVTTFTKKFLL